MLTRTLTPAPSSGPGPGLLFALSAWTWSGPGPDGQDIAHVLPAHPPGRTSHDTPAAIATAARLDTYLDAGRTADRLLFGLAHAS
ncbi:hypothetical protein GCM10010218_27190 [Streptomyces mashuensis]|uniref:Uncharacterized protein n=1 Tax=Streptomyces mashuensis TaxID=33904 RepID=A0A919EBU2_9ACTN|nr:hypothetical protein [Streptomyces mashuensis]GHF44414.1 hypothetical protein GCM10010218_27190 [Streptomyces mashuensis]